MLPGIFTALRFNASTIKYFPCPKKQKEAGDRGINKYKSLLDPIICTTVSAIITKKVIGKGDWYTLSEAIRIIKSQDFNCQKEIT